MAETKNQAQKKESTYQKLSVFNLMETKENVLEADE